MSGSISTPTTREAVLKIASPKSDALSVTSVVRRSPRSVRAATATVTSKGAVLRSAEDHPPSRCCASPTSRSVSVG
ncbi:MAG: hypothetical protein LC785_16050 [Acidobacteria bacterium]|nr:hypothetical protein [Acidobacteriota bacterium]